MSYPLPVFVLFEGRIGREYCARIGKNKEGQIMEEEKKNTAGERFGTDSILLDLIKRSREGDSEAMESVFERFKTSIFNLAYRYTYNTAAAEDLLQDIFLKVYTRFKELDNDEAFVGWLYRVAVNTCLTHLRSRNVRLRKTVPLSEVEGKLSGNSVPDRVENKPLEDAIQSLSTKLKSIFLLHDVQGFKHREIAQIMRCSVGTSKSQLFKARMKIRKKLECKQMM